MSEQQSSYRQIMKATSIFGGVQVFQILIQVIRSKFVAVLLGPAGMGIVGLLTTATGLISGLTNFGLGTSAVKNVAAANSTGNQTRIAVIITVLRRWVWITGLLGMIATVATAPLLSKLTFGNKEYTLPFIWISVSLLLTQLSSGQLILLQGMRQIHYLAKANLAGSILSLVITVPLYYLLGFRGIVPVIIVNSVLTLLGSWFFARKIKIEKVFVSKARTMAEGKDMLIMGFLISVSSLISLGASYLIRIVIGRTGGIGDVGLYSAGFLILNTYVGLIFKAMATDYYPRLSSVAHDNRLCRETINQQAEIAILLLAPIIIIFLVFIRFLIVLLFSRSFLPVVDMIKWASIGMLFSGASWSIAFIFLAKGSSKLFFWNELAANIYILAFNIAGYYFGGLTGLGIAYILGYVAYLVQVYVISHQRYGFSFNHEFVLIFLFQLLLATICLAVVRYVSQPYSWGINLILLVVSAWYSYRELDKRMGISLLIRAYISKFRSGSGR